MKTKLQTIQFHNQSLVTFKQGDTYYTAMKPICENIGLDWKAQYARIKRDDVLNSTMVMITIVAEDGKKRGMLCLPIQYLNGWLFGIDTKRVKPEIKETLITYKKECYQVLFDYWNKGKAEKEISQTDTITPAEQRAIQNAVSDTHKQTGMSYGEIWARVKNKFGVAKYDQIKRQDYSFALTYIASMQRFALLESEKKYPFNLTEQDLQAIAWDWFALLKCVEFTSSLIPALENIQSKFTAQAHSIVSEYGSMLRIHQPLIQKLTADFKVGMWGDENWNRVLPTIRDNDVLQPKRRLGRF